MYAVVEFGGKQYRVEKDMVLLVDKVKGDSPTLKIDNVLLCSDGSKISVGKPYVSGASVSASIMGTVKSKKVRGFKFRRRKKYRRTLGHRQEYLQIKINEVKTA